MAIKGIPWVGGKTKLVTELNKVFGYITRKYDTRTFIDGCCGGGKITLNLDKLSYKQVYSNDLDRGIVFLFEILKSNEKTKLLIKIIDELINDSISYKELVIYANGNGRSSGENEFLLAAYTVVSAYGSVKSTKSGFDSIRFKEYFLVNKNHHNLYRFTSSLRRVTMLNKDVFELIELVGECESILMYIDCPYHPNAMKGDNHYGVYTWSVEQHQALVQLLRNPKIKMKWVLSGWMNNDYKALTDDGFAWYYPLKKLTILSRNKKGDSDSEDENKVETEYIWSNVALPNNVLPTL